MNARLCKAAFVALALTGCSSNPVKTLPMDQVYGDVHRQGSRDMVDLLRQGMNSKNVFGYSDPYYPIRQPEEVMAVWVTDWVSPKTGRKIAGHWEYTVIKPASWAD